MYSMGLGPCFCNLLSTPVSAAFPSHLQLIHWLCLLFSFLSLRSSALWLEAATCWWAFSITPTCLRAPTSECHKPLHSPCLAILKFRSLSLSIYCFKDLMHSAYLVTTCSSNMSGQMELCPPGPLCNPAPGLVPWHLPPTSNCCGWAAPLHCTLTVWLLPPGHT